MSQTSTSHSARRRPNAAADALRDELETKLLATAQGLYELEIRAGDVVPGMENFMESSVEQLVKDYAELSALAQRMMGIDGDNVTFDDNLLPGSLLERIDNLQNPHELTKELLVTALEQNQYGNAKMHAFGTFHDLLAEQVAETFPEMRELLKVPPKAKASDGVDEEEQKTDTRVTANNGAVSESIKTEPATSASRLLTDSTYVVKQEQVRNDAATTQQDHRPGDVSVKTDDSHQQPQQDVQMG